MKKTGIVAAVFLLILFVLPIWANQGLDGGGENTVVSVGEKVQGTQTKTEEAAQEAFKDPRSLFKEARKRLLLAQSEIVRQANEAKNRVELILNEYLESAANKMESDTNIDDLKRDLEKVKESQKNVTGIIKEVKTVLDQELDPRVNLNSPDYLQTLTAVYIEKAALLEKEAGILSKIARPPGEIDITPTPAPTTSVSEAAGENGGK